ncbi:hypothetical protein MASR2M47_39870 [Draconibacterium sp.]|jgi:hypothetical protein
MKATTRSSFSHSLAERKSFSDNNDKIEVVSCPRKEMICQGHLAIINKHYVLSEQSFKDKNFDQSIDTLKDAYYETMKIVDTPCIGCAKLFRSTITESLENMHSDLEKMTSGIFGKKSYQPSKKKAVDVLNEFEKMKLNETLKLNNAKKRYVGEYV